MFKVFGKAQNIWQLLKKNKIKKSICIVFSTIANASNAQVASAFNKICKLDLNQNKVAILINWKISQPCSDFSSLSQISCTFKFYDLKSNMKRTVLKRTSIK